MVGMGISGVGQVWIMPIGADDFVPVTEHVASYEHDGVLHLAESIGTVEADGLVLDETDPPASGLR